VNDNKLSLWQSLTLVTVYALIDDTFVSFLIQLLLFLLSTVLLKIKAWTKLTKLEAYIKFTECNKNQGTSN